MAKSKKRATKSTAQSKAAFARGFPKGTPASAIVAAGAKQGIKLSKRYVWNARSNSGSARGKRGASVPASNPRRPVERRVAASAVSPLFDAWLDVALLKGSEAADVIVDSARRRLVEIRAALRTTRRLG